MAKSPLSQVGIEFADQQLITLGSGYQAVSFNYTLQHGTVPHDPKDTMYGGDQYIDFGNSPVPFGQDGYEPHDPFTSALETVRHNTIERIQNDPEMQALLQDPNWSEGDRIKWEAKLSQITSEELNKIQGLGTYRLEGDQHVDGSQTEIRPDRLNDLNEDILNGSQKVEFDCEAMSVVEGTLMQAVENTFLAGNDPSPDNLKFAGNYFYTTGGVFFGPSSGGVGGHAYVLSSVTGNVFEATADPDSRYGNDSYRITDANFVEIIAGKTFNSYGFKDNYDLAVYGSWDAAGEDGTYTSRLSAISNGAYDTLGNSQNQFSRNNKYAEYNHYVAIYNQGQTQTVTIPPVTPNENDPLIAIRQEALDAKLLLHEKMYLRLDYNAHVATYEEIKDGDSIVFKSDNGDKDILVTKLPDGNFEFKDVTDINLPSVPTSAYSNIWDVPPDRPQPAPVVTQPEPNPTPDPAPVVVSPAPAPRPTPEPAPQPPSQPEYAYAIDPPPYEFNPIVQEFQQNANELAQRLGLQDVDLGTSKTPSGTDGYFGPKTEAAVIAIQTALGMQPTGIITPDLMTQMEQKLELGHDTTYGPQGAVPDRWDESLANRYYVAAARMDRDQPHALSSQFGNAHGPTSEEMVQALLPQNNQTFGMGS